MKASKISIVLAGVVGICYLFRQSIFRILFNFSIIRKTGTRLFMKIPYLRNKLMKSMFSQ